MADARLIAAALGAVTGVRSTAGVAALAHRDAGAGMMEKLVARGTTLLASGEALADKAVDLPARTQPVPLAARALLGAVAAGLFARRRGTNIVEAVAIGATAAIVTAFAATNLRRIVTTRTAVPDAAVGALEDVLVLAGSAWVVREAAAPKRWLRR